MYEKICKACGTRLSTFYQTFMLGCPECYRAFRQEILVSAKKVHGSTVHTGKVPKTESVDKELLMEYEMLIKEREDAILKGQFSRAKELAESIVELGEELKKRGLK